MNIKVVIVWAFVVMLFAGLGIFGYVNQDLLLLDDTEPYTPIQDTPTQNDIVTSTKTCNVDLVNGKSSYSFSIKDDKIENMSITYTTTQEDGDAFTAASNINTTITGENVNGVSTVLTGSAADFSLVVNVNINDYDTLKIATMNEDFSKLSMMINNLNDYETYKGVLSQTGYTYICE